MSLKAYDGMMTKEGFPYLQEKIKENLPKFKEASIKQIGGAYAEIITKYVDNLMSFKGSINVMNMTKSERDEIDKIEIDNKTTLITYLFQVASILSKSVFVNEFTSDLKLTIEQKNDKLLVYPGINVPEHRKILLTFLNFWYAQDQCDPDENVPEDEWNERCKDWYDFNETRGLQISIHLFDPQHHWNNLIDHLRGDELFDAIISNIEDDGTRKKHIWYNKFMSILMERYVEDKNMDKYWKSRDYLSTDEGKLEYEKYKQENPIELTPITVELLKTLKVK